MSQNELHIVYCKYNEPEVISATTRLKTAGFTFNQVNSSDFEAKQDFATAIAGLKGRILLFLSDNFLKSITCMNGTIPILEKLLKSGRAFPVLLDGHYPNDSDKNNYRLVSTQLSRVGHILKYMNYWQQAYIKRRKEKSTTPTDQIANFERSLKDIKAISTAIPAFLAFLKEENCMNYDSFKMNHFEVFFQEFSHKNNFKRFSEMDTEEDVVAVAVTPILPKNAIIPGEHIEPVGILKINGKIPADLITINNPELFPISAQVVQAARPEQVAKSVQVARSSQKVMSPSITIEHAGMNSFEELFLEETTPSPPIPMPNRTKITATPEEVFANSKGKSVGFTYTELPSTPDQSIFRAESIEETNTPPMTAYVTVTPTETAGTVKTSVSMTPPKPVARVTKTHQKIRTHYTIAELQENSTVIDKIITTAIPAEEAIASPPLQPLQKGEKIIMVMGATSPIGRAAVTAFAKQGCRVILTGNRFSQLYKMQRELEEEYQKEVQLLPFDPNVAISMDSIVEDLELAWRNIDLLLNISDLTTIPSTSDWHQLLHANIQGLYNITHKIVPYLKARQKGQIINLAALDSHPDKVAISKALQQGISAFTETIQLDLHAHHIKVSQLFPEYTGTQDAAINEAIAKVIYFMSVQSDAMTIKNVTMGGE